MKVSTCISLTIKNVSDEADPRSTWLSHSGPHTIIIVTGVQDRYGQKQNTNFQGDERNYFVVVNMLK